MSELVSRAAVARVNTGLTIPTNVPGNPPSMNRQRAIPQSRSGVCLENTNAPARAREKPRHATTTHPRRSGRGRPGPPRAAARHRLAELPRPIDRPLKRPRRAARTTAGPPAGSHRRPSLTVQPNGSSSSRTRTPELGVVLQQPMDLLLETAPLGPRRRPSIAGGPSATPNARRTMLRSRPVRRVDLLDTTHRPMEEHPADLSPLLHPDHPALLICV